MIRTFYLYHYDEKNKEKWPTKCTVVYVTFEGQN